jgi:hypothetical protein
MDAFQPSPTDLISDPRVDPDLGEALVYFDLKNPESLDPGEGGGRVTGC